GAARLFVLDGVALCDRCFLGAIGVLSLNEGFSKTTRANPVRARADGEPGGRSACGPVVPAGGARPTATREDALLLSATHAPTWRRCVRPSWSLPGNAA